MSTHLTSVHDVIAALGGPSAAARLLGYAGPAAATNWKARDSLPPHKYLVMQAELRRRGLTAPPSLWGITEPVEAAE